MKFEYPRIKKRFISAILLLVVLAVGGNTTESIKIRHLVKQIAENSRNNNNNMTVTSTESSFMTPSALVAAESLQVQRQAFLSVILSYLAKPEENPDIALEGRDSSSTSSEGDTMSTNNGHHHGDDNNLTAGQSWSRFADSHIHLRVLRSTSEEQPEARALFFGRPSSSSNRRHINNNRRHHQFQRPGSAQLGPPISNSAELVNLLRENLNRQRRRNHLVNGEAEETSATIEVVQTRTPFVMMDGEMIMNDLPMVERRSIPQFGGMVILYTRASPLRLLYYGNWCGSGGMGPALDNIDQCCMTHDKCYGDVEKLPCKGIFQTPYSVHYAWRWVEDRKQAYCLRTGDRCADMTCECDRIAASCFAKHMINAKLKGNRLRKHRNRIKYPILRGQ